VRMDLLSIGWKPLRKIKAGVIAAAVVQGLTKTRCADEEADGREETQGGLVSAT
jgi:hypothetical protein